jgi:hypothetical protein
MQIFAFAARTKFRHCEFDAGMPADDFGRRCTRIGARHDTFATAGVRRFPL